MNKPTDQQLGCSICRKYTDSICNNFCLMTKAQKQNFIKTKEQLLNKGDKNDN